jgi:hypothetical protein
VPGSLVAVGQALVDHAVERCCAGLEGFSRFSDQAAIQRFGYLLDRGPHPGAQCHVVLTTLFGLFGSFCC